MGRIKQLGQVVVSAIVNDLPEVYDRTNVNDVNVMTLQPSAVIFSDRKIDRTALRRVIVREDFSYGTYPYKSRVRINENQCGAK